jgi:nucleoside-diphosphate-sugar epimerase
VNRDTVAVIGGNGFIGTHLVQLLLSEGWKVRVIGRSQTPPGAADAVEQIAASVADAEAISRAIEGADYVVHLGTGGGDTWADFERDFIQGTKNVADACTRAAVKRLIYTSSIAALYLGGRDTITDDTAADPQASRRSYYARAKVAAEAILLERSRRGELPAVILRPGVVMGPGGILSHSGIGYWPADLLCLGWGRGTHPLPFVLASDVAQALRAAITAASVEGKTLNLASDVKMSAAEFVQELAVRSCRNYRFYPQSLAKLQVLEIVKWVAKIIAGRRGTAFPSYRDLKSRSLRAPFDCSQAKQLLGWKPENHRETFLREAIDANLQSIMQGDLRLEGFTTG